MLTAKALVPAALVLLMAVGSVVAMGDEIKGKLIYAFEDEDEFDDWQVTNDTVMGGVSEGTFEPGDEGTAIFSGTVSLENNGGFASARSKATEHGLSAQVGLAIRVKGDGRKYKLSLRQDGQWDGVMYQAPFEAPADEWVVILLPFPRFVATHHGQTVDDAPEAQANRLRSVGFLIGDKQAGPFRLQIDWIRAYTDQ